MTPMRSQSFIYPSVCGCTGSATSRTSSSSSSSMCPGSGAPLSAAVSISWLRSFMILRNYPGSLFRCSSTLLCTLSPDGFGANFVCTPAEDDADVVVAGGAVVLSAEVVAGTSAARACPAGGGVCT